MKMRDAIAKGLNFYQWKTTQEVEPPKNTWNTLQLQFAALQEELIPPSFRKSAPEQWIVINHLTGWPIKADQLAFKIHGNQEAAQTYGKEYYGYGKFKVVPFQIWKHSRQAKFLMLKQAINERIINKKPKQPTQSTQKPKCPFGLGWQFIKTELKNEIGRDGNITARKHQVWRNLRTKKLVWTTQ